MTIKRKNTVLIIGFFGVLTLGYYLAIQDTIILRSNYNELQQQEVLFRNIPHRIHALEQKNKHYDSLLIHYQIAETSLQNNLLKTIERYALLYKLKVLTLNEPHIKETNGRTINSYAFTVTGDFQAILGLAYQLEQKSKFGKIASLDFEKIKNYRTGRNSLNGNFILQLVQ